MEKGMNEIKSMITEIANKTNLREKVHALTVMLCKTLPEEWSTNFPDEESRIILIPVRVPRVIVHGAEVISTDKDHADTIIREFGQFLFDKGLTMAAIESYARFAEATGEKDASN